MKGYYHDKLHGNRLKRCYDIAPPRILQYLRAEIQYVIGKVPSDSRVLELGCGYGRVLIHVAQKARSAYGVDIARSNIELARDVTAAYSNCQLLTMDALKLGFRDGSFDAVVCIQNGISAFHVDQRALIRESIRVTRNRGLVLYSSYSDKIWQDRLHWFSLQADAGLIGAIDMQKTNRGLIICKDGFEATTVSEEQFHELVRGLPADITLEEVDGSSLFCTLTVKKP